MSRPDLANETIRVIPYPFWDLVSCSEAKNAVFARSASYKSLLMFDPDGCEPRLFTRYFVADIRDWVANWRFVRMAALDAQANAGPLQLPRQDAVESP
jgi:hypothetical protein